MGRSYYAITEDLRSTFLSIYHLWDDKRSEALAMRMLEEDIALIGVYFGGNAQRTNSIAAKSITILRICDAESCSSAQRDMVEKEVEALLYQDNFYANIAPNLEVKDVIQHCKSWALIKELREQNRLGEELLHQFQRHCIELIDMFYATTGALSAENMQKMAEFERLTSID